MIRKSGTRFSDKIMLKQWARNGMTIRRPVLEATIMRTDLFDFELPAENIALRPASPRNSARMLVVKGDRLDDRVVSDLPSFLEPGDQVVVNDTKVISAQLHGRRIGRETEPKIDATLIKRIDGSRWQALARPAKKLAEGDRIVSATRAGSACSAISTPR